MQAKAIGAPVLSEQEVADLFAYFFAARYFERPGDSAQGRRVFQSKQCGQCHGLMSPLHEGIRPISAWQSLADPISLAQQMWTHSAEMVAAAQSRSIPFPSLKAQELTDLLAFPARPVESRQPPGSLPTGLRRDRRGSVCVEGLRRLS